MPLFYEKYQSPMFKRVVDSLCTVKPFTWMFWHQFDRSYQDNKTLASCKARFPEFSRGFKPTLAVYDELEFDRVWGINPCSEIKLPTTNRAAVWNGVAA